MKYLLSALFIITSANSYAGEYEDMCLKIGYKADTEKFDTCIKKLEARKKPLNKVPDNKLAKKGGIKNEVIVGIGLEVGASMLANDVIKNNSGSSSKSINQTKKAKSFCQKSPLSSLCKVPTAYDGHKVGGWPY